MLTLAHTTTPVHTSMDYLEKYIKKAFSSLKSLLPVSIRQWIDDLYSQWKWFFSPINDVVYHNIMNNAQTYTRQGARERRYHHPKFKRSHVIRFISLYAHWVTCKYSNTIVRLFGWEQENKTTIKNSTSLILSQSILQTPPQW